MTLIIRNEQKDEYKARLNEDYIEKLAAELRAEHPEDVEQYTDEELHEGIAAGIRRAESYGLEGDADVQAFVELLFTIGWYFDRYPPFHAVLTQPLYEHYQKMPYLFESAEDEDWEAAAAESERELEAEEE